MKILKLKFLCICSTLVLFANNSFSQQLIQLEGTVIEQSDDNSTLDLQVSRAATIGYLLPVRTPNVSSIGYLIPVRGLAAHSSEIDNKHLSDPMIVISLDGFIGSILVYRSTASIAGGAINYSQQNSKVGNKWFGTGTLLENGTIQIEEIKITE